MKNTIRFIVLLSLVSSSCIALAADFVPNEIQMPGTQPKEVNNFDTPDRCDNCHGGFDEVTYPQEPAFGWRGSAMGNAGRDPIFWATLAVAEQDFDGAGDLCIRCHSAAGWIAGRSTPTDGSGLNQNDADGVDCDTCHKSTNPDQSEHIGVYYPPFEPFDYFGNGEYEGYYGSGMLQVWGGAEKLGPYTADDAQAKHQRMQSKFHRNEDFCGTCHDVSNPAVGDLATNNGTQPGAPAVTSSGGNLGGPVDEKAAFNNPPYVYGIVERTFSEYKSSGFSKMPISGFTGLPADLQVAGGAIQLAANAAGTSNDDGTPRYFTCQGCHMRATTGVGANKRGTPVRTDLPMHDLTGGNHWVYPLVKYQDQNGILRLGSGLTATQSAAMDAGVTRAEDSLRSAVALEVNGNTVTLTNLTGHKLISGYPEGRRMWLNIKWRDANGEYMPQYEVGKYGDLPASFTYTAPDGTPRTFTPRSIVDLENTEVYEAHYAVTSDWAATIESLHGSDFPLSFDRMTGDVDCTAGLFLSDGCTGPAEYHETFHFALNNYVAKDNRIPPYGMSYDIAKSRNALPVPDTQFGDPGPGGTYDYHDEIILSPPAGAESADITLYYQGTSWEYVLFLWQANNGGNAFLGQEGVNMLDAWVNTGMVEPFAMANATWGTPPTCTPTDISESICNGVDDDCDSLTDEDYAPTSTICGIGVCEDTGVTTCTDGTVGDTCVPGQPTESPEVSCTDGLDNDCDGATDAADTDCSAPPMTCGDYTSGKDCKDNGCSWVKGTCMQ